MDYDDDEQGVLEPPRYDMLDVKFRGDDHRLLLPYCEVANGDLSEVSNGNVKIAINIENKPNSVNLTYSKFVEMLEQTFDTKEIINLSVQLAGSYDTITVL